MSRIGSIAYCGACCHFKHEDTDGYGWCYKFDVTGIERYCGDSACDDYYVSIDGKRHHLAMLRSCQRCLRTADNRDMDVKSMCEAIDFVVDYVKTY